MADYNSTYTGAQIDANLALAATAVQDADLGTAAFTASTAYATAAQGTLADSATQPGDDAADLGSGAATDGYVLTADGAGGAAWEAASGGGGTPGGSDTQVQFNDGGAFGGDSGFTFDKTNTTLGLGGGTITASDPILDMAQTWNNAAVTFTALKANVTSTASAAGSLLMDLQVGGVSQFKVTKAGLIETAHITTSIGSINGTSVVVTTKDSRWLVLDSGSGIAMGSSGARFLAGSINLGAVSLGFGTSSNTNDTILTRDAANTLAQRNGVNAQAFNLYNSFTDASNYERLEFKWLSNIATLESVAAGTGTRRALRLKSGGGSLDITNFTATANLNLEMAGNFITGPAYIQFTEQTAPAAPATNAVRIYAEDDGAGKTRLMARFATGASVQIAIEP